MTKKIQHEGWINQKTLYFNGTSSFFYALVYLIYKKTTSFKCFLLVKNRAKNMP